MTAGTCKSWSTIFALIASGTLFDLAGTAVKTLFMLRGGRRAVTVPGVKVTGVCLRSRAEFWQLLLASGDIHCPERDCVFPSDS